MHKVGNVVYQIGKFEESKSCLSISIFKRTIYELQKGYEHRWWLLNSQGVMCGGADDNELFNTREEALDFIKTKENILLMILCFA